MIKDSSCSISASFLGFPLFRYLLIAFARIWMRTNPGITKTSEKPLALPYADINVIFGLNMRGKRRAVPNLEAKTFRIFL